MVKMSESVARAFKAFALGVLGVCLAPVTSAETIPWTEPPASETGAFGQGLSGTNALALPKGDYLCRASSVAFYADAEGASLSVDGTGGSFGLPARSDGFEYDLVPWSLIGPMGAIVQLKRESHASAQAPSGPTDAVLASTNGRFRVFNDGTGATEAHFDGGDWNLSTPDGETVSGNTLFVCDAADRLSRTYIHGGSYALAALRYDAWGTEENLFQIDGGAKVTVAESFCWMKRTDNREVTDEWVVTGEGTELSFAKTFWVSSLFENPVSKNPLRTLQWTVRDGAKVSMHSLYHRGAGNLRLEIDGGSFEAEAGPSYVGWWDGSGECNIVVNNGSFKANSLYLGDKIPCSFFATNSTIEGISDRIGKKARLGFENCVFSKGLHLPGSTDGGVQEVVVRGGGQNIGDDNVGNVTAGGHARLILDNCSKKASDNAMYLGSVERAVGELILTNNTTYLRSGYLYAGSGAAAWGKLTVVCGAVYDQSHWNVNIGTGVGSTGILEVGSGGEYRHPTVGLPAAILDTYHFLLGTRGRGELIVNDGGIVRERRIRVGGEATGQGHIYLNAGGYLDVINILTNGVGYGELHANGGTLHGREACANFLQDLAKAEIGEKGLTVESDNALTIAQPFSNMSGASGVLTLTGAGAKTLTGASTHAKTRVVEGAATIGSMAGTVEVVNGAKLDYANGVADTVTLGGLVLGDAETVGYLAVDPTDVITVTGAMDFTNAQINLSDAFAEDGDYSLFRTTGPVPEEVQAAWAKALVALGRVDGKAYVFSTQADDEGVTHFRVTVAPKSDVTQERAWRGTGDAGAWKTAANWEGATVPSATEIARFDSGATAKSVTVDGLVTPGALTFAAGGYVLSGEGNIRLSPAVNGFVSALVGANEVGVGLTLDGETPFSVEDNARLTLAGNIAGGGLVKQGAGELVVAGTNAFVNGFTSENGRTTVRGVAAFGMTGDLAMKDVVQKGGTLRVEGTENDAVLHGALAPDAGANLPYIIDTATPLTVTGFKRTSGCLVKRGAGRLTIETDKDIVLSTNSGDSDGTFVYGKKSPLFSFPADGTLGTDVHYAGVNVVEGELLVKGVTEKPPTVTFKGPANVGMNTPDGVAEPRLIFDHVDVQNNGGTRPLALCKMANAEAFLSRPLLRFQNGAKISAAMMTVGAGHLNTGSCEKEIFPRIEVDGSEVLGYGGMIVDGGPLAQTAIDVRNGSRFAQQSITFSSSTTLLVDGSTFTYVNNPGKLVSLTVGWAADFSAVFQNGSVVQMGWVRRGARPNYTHSYGHNPISFAFDDARWETNGNDLRFLAAGGETIMLDVRAGGLEINAPTGLMRVETPFTGVGTLAKTGAGTIWFDTAKTIEDSSKYGVSGPTNLLERTETMAAACLAVDEGVAMVSNGTVHVDSAITVAAGAVLDLCGSTVEVGAIGGGGTVRNGTLKARRFLVDGTGPLAFENATLAGKGSLRLDFGRDAADPVDYKRISPLTLATFAGVDQPPLRLGTVNSGLPHLSAKATLQDGVLTAELFESGLAIIIR